MTAVMGLRVLRWCGAVVACMVALAPPASAAPAATPVQRLHALFDAAWERDLRDDPLAATYYGDTRFNDRWPGQLKILELRALAERELGSRFDIRAFHDTLLGSGALPLDVLEVNVRSWIAAQRHRTAARKP